MRSTTTAVRVLGPSDLPAALAILADDPVRNVFVESRVRRTQMDPRLLGGEMWGFERGGELVSLCHVGANLVVANGDDESIDAFGRRAARSRRPMTVVGYQDDVARLWPLLRPRWGEARDERWNQPHLELTGTPSVPGDPAVRRSTEDDFERLYPACVAMYTEEVGVSPESDGGAALYRVRVRALIAQGHSFGRYDADGDPEFKAEVACVTPSAAQIQGVYVSPAVRGQGIAAPCMAAVAELMLAEAPVVSLYVNDYNAPARAAYARAGFVQTATFASIHM